MDLFFDSFNSKLDRRIVRKAMARRYGAFGGGPGSLLIGGDLGGTVGAPTVTGSHFKGNPYFDVKAYGAVGDGATDDTAAVNAAIAAALAAAPAAGGALIFFPAGTYKVTSALTTINQHRVNVLGEGPQASVISFVPAAGASCFTFKLAAATILSQCSIKGLGFTSADVTFAKVAIDLIDVDIFSVEEIGTASWTGATSIGLRIRGRDAISVRRVTFAADIPIDIGINPNNTITLDHAHFQDLYLVASGNPCVRVADGANLSEVSFDGYQAWVGGTYGLYWNDTTTVGVSHGLTIKNLRTEQGSAATAYSVYISHNSQLQDLTLENCYLDLARKGMFLRKVTKTLLTAVLYGSTSKEGLNMSAANGDTLELRNCAFSAGGTVSLTGMTRKWSLNKVASGSPIEDTCFYVFDPGVATQLEVGIYSGKVWSWTGDLASGASKGIPASNNTGRSSAMIFVVAADGTGAKREGGMMIDDSNGNVVASGTANFVVGNVGGKLCVLHSGTTDIINNLGTTVHVSVFVVWF